MDSIGVNASFLLVQCLAILLVLTWATLSLAALFSMRHREMDRQTQVLWVLVILLAPTLGALAFWIIDPGSRSQTPPAA